MSYRDILEFPNASLKKVCIPVTAFNDDVKLLAQDLFDTCNVKHGAGLAAPQIGANCRVIIINCAAVECTAPDPYSTDSNYWVLVNPELALHGAKVSWEEACLSVPDTHAQVERYSHVHVNYQNINGEECQADISWPLAGIVEHECDHLDGQLYIDRISRLKKSIALRRMKKAKRKQIQFIKNLELEREALAGPKTRVRRRRTKSRRKNV